MKNGRVFLSFRAIREIIHSKFLYVSHSKFLQKDSFSSPIRFCRQLDKMIEFCLQMADSNTSNDDKQMIELKLVNLIHAIALRKLI